MTYKDFLSRLDRGRPHGVNRWLARCPAHADRSPSLSVREVDNKILVHCFAGCELQEIVEVLGLTTADLFTNSPTALKQRPTSSCHKVDLNALAFRFELAALDRRLRADRVLKAVAGFSKDEMGDEECDRLMKVVARAYDDQDRAEFLETVADELRVKAYQERTAHHAA